MKRMIPWESFPKLRAQVLDPGPCGFPHLLCTPWTGLATATRSWDIADFCTRSFQTYLETAGILMHQFSKLKLLQATAVTGQVCYFSCLRWHLYQK